MFFGYGNRLKWRVGWTLFAFAITFASVFWYREHVFAWLLAPAEGQLSPFEDGAPVFTAVQDMFSITFWIALRAGIVAALFAATVGLYTLISPMLSRRARWGIRIALPTPFLLFIGGAAFVYYVMLPVGLNFLLHFGDGVAIAVIELDQYLNLLAALMMAMGLVFQLPLAMFSLTKFKITSYQRLKKFRKFVPFMAMILGVVLTPPDLLSMFMVAVPIIVLYEFGLFCSWAARPEAGNYMWFGTLTRIVKRIWRVITSPYRGVRWLYRKVRFW